MVLLYHIQQEIHNAQGIWQLWSLETEVTINLRNWRDLPIPDVVINKANQLGTMDGQKDTTEKFVYTGSWGSGLNNNDVHESPTI